MIEALDTHTGKITVDYGEVHNLSVELLKQVYNSDGATAMSALLLTAARVLSPEVLTDDQEIAFLTASAEWMGLYFAGGGAN